MAPLSPNHRPGCARLGIARLNAFRLNVYESIIGTVVNGVPVGVGGGGAAGTGLRIEGANIQHVLNDQTDTASFRTRGFTPVAGQTIAVYDGEATSNHQLFGGRILATTLLYEKRKQNIAHDIRCIDPTWLLNRRKVLATYVNQSATAIILDITARFLRGVTTKHVQAGLPVIDAITFTNESPAQCFSTICERIGGSWFVEFVDYANDDLWVFTTQSEKANDITDANPRTSRNHQLTEDLSQVVTRVIGRGGGVGASIDQPAGSVELLVEEGDEPQSWYSPTGGTVEVNTQLVTYSGVRGLGATGALVGTGNAPSAAPLPTPYQGTSHTLNATYGYAVSYVTGSGETLAGPIAAIKLTPISPVAPPWTAARSRGSSAYPPGMISPGANAFSFAIQIRYRDGANGPLGAQSQVYGWDGNDWEVYIGSRVYYTHSDGTQAFYYPTLEPGGPAAPTNYVDIWRQDSAGGQGWMRVSGDGFYNSSTGYVYQCACSYSIGGQPPLPTTQYGGVLLKSIPISKAPGVTSRKVYRTTANGSALKLAGTVADNTATSWYDDRTDAQLGAAPPTADASGIKDEGQVLIGATALPVSATAPFEADMIGGVNPGGWVRTGGMILRYTGIGNGTLTGVPASGIGSITAVIRYGAQVLVQSRLVGIPASGTGAMLAPIRKGDTVTIRIVVEDVAAQDAFAARIGGTRDDGVVEGVVSDSRFGLVELTAQCTAYLTERKHPHKTLTFESRDPSLEVGRLLTINIAEPPIAGTFRIQRVTFSEIAIAGGRATALPLRHVEATNKLFTLANLLRQLLGREGGVP